MQSIPTDPHPILRHGDFVTSFSEPLGSLASPTWLLDLFRVDAEAPLSRDEETRGKIRDLLRHGGYKPTGRGKPSSEYLVRAASEGTLGSINLAVDVCNAVSLHSALPVSVIDLDRATPPLKIALGAKDSEYIFNASGQMIDVEGLLCLHDALGPCANAVKDAQRTKTGPETRRTLSIVWAAVGLEDRLDRALAWYREILVRAGVPMP
jgi:DNA/RNA-binding domain of Phe-tRNA-synthetase-like protein